MRSPGLLLLDPSGIAGASRVRASGRAGDGGLGDEGGGAHAPATERTSAGAGAADAAKPFPQLRKPLSQNFLLRPSGVDAIFVNASCW